MQRGFTCCSATLTYLLITCAISSDVALDHKGVAAAHASENDTSGVLVQDAATHLGAKSVNARVSEPSTEHIDNQTADSAVNRPLEELQKPDGPVGKAEDSDTKQNSSERLQQEDDSKRQTGT